MTTVPHWNNRKITRSWRKPWIDVSCCTQKFIRKEFRVQGKALVQEVVCKLSETQPSGMKGKFHSRGTKGESCLTE